MVKKNLAQYEKHLDDCGYDLSYTLIEGPDRWCDVYTYDVYLNAVSGIRPWGVSDVEHDEVDRTLVHPDGVFLLGAGAEQQPWRFTRYAEQVY